jgi:hypothetical protein
MSTRALLLKTKKQSGMATLVIVVILLALLTLTVLIVSRATVTELKVSSNQNREKEAFAAAQAGLDRGAQSFLQSGSVVTSSGAIGSTDSVYTYSGTVSGGEATITGFGSSLDGTGSATVSEIITLSSAPGYGKLVPFLASGNIPTGGGFTLVPNPNAGSQIDGNGVPVAAWSSNAGASGLSSWDVCEYDEYKSDQCIGAASKGGYMCTKDIEDNCPAFVQDSGVPDPFATLFNLENIGCDANGFSDDSSSCAITLLRNSYTAANNGSNPFTCGTDGPRPASGLTFDEAISKSKAFGPLGLPVIWIEGDCDIKSDLGSEDSPVIVVIEGDVGLQSGETFGIVLALTDEYTAAGQTAIADNGGSYNELKYNGNAVINGAVLTNNEITQTNGSGVVAWSPGVLSKLTEDGEDGLGVVRAQGTWRDF